MLFSFQEYEGDIHIFTYRGMNCAHCVFTCRFSGTGCLYGRSTSEPSRRASPGQKAWSAWGRCGTLGRRTGINFSPAMWLRWRAICSSTPLVSIPMARWTLCPGVPRFQTSAGTSAARSWISKKTSQYEHKLIWGDHYRCRWCHSLSGEKKIPCFLFDWFKRSPSFCTKVIIIRD